MLGSVEACEATNEDFGRERDVEVGSRGGMVFRIEGVHAKDILTGY